MLAGGGAGESQAVQKQREFGSGMPAEHRRVSDVTQGGKKSDKKPQLDTLSTLDRTGESGGLWETWGGERQRYRSTVDR